MKFKDAEGRKKKSSFLTPLYNHVIQKSSTFSREERLQKKNFCGNSRSSINKKRFSRQYFQNPNEGPDFDFYDDGHAINAKRIVNENQRCVLEE